MKTKIPYKPYNFSKGKCHVVSINLKTDGIFKIEEKLPLHLEKLTGIYISCNSVATDRVLGYMTIMFNEGVLKTAQLPILNSRLIKDHSHPIPLNETIKSNSIMQGYLYIITGIDQPFTLKVYLHYEQWIMKQL